METKELKITIPEGQEIDWQESTKQEKIVFRKKDTRPRSWEEYRAKVPENKLYKVWGVVEGNELSEAFLAMIQLMSLRQAWIGDWKLLNEECAIWWGVCYEPCNDSFEIEYSCIINFPLSFPTKEMAEDFMICFKDLLEIAKPLL